VRFVERRQKSGIEDQTGQLGNDSARLVRVLSRRGDETCAKFVQAWTRLVVRSMYITAHHTPQAHVRIVICLLFIAIHFPFDSYAKGKTTSDGFYRGVTNNCKEIDDTLCVDSIAGVDAAHVVVGSFNANERGSRAEKVELVNSAAALLVWTQHM
jgi:hypothetical protein